MSQPAAAVRPPDSRRLLVYMLSGAVAGAAYVLFDIDAEAKLASGTLTGVLARLHDAVDHVLPLFAGILLGVCAHYLRLRARLAVADEEARRAEGLRERLHKVERDQAAWVLAAAVLHELNNPLHALGLALDELAGAVETAGVPSSAVAKGPRLGGIANAEIVELVERARSQSARALAHLRTLRSMRGEGEPELQQVALEEVVAALAADVRSLAAKDGHAVVAVLDGSIHAKADPTYVRIILENLLGNSLHALREREGGTITIRLGTEGDRAVVGITDDGAPVDSRARKLLFEPLHTTKSRGLGLGLPIARALARAMDGDVTFDAAGGKAFRIELPLTEAAP